MLNSNECEEVYEFLSHMNKLDVMQIPENILKYLKNKRNKEFNTKIDKNDLFNFNNISENSLNFLIYLDKIYWQKVDNKIFNEEENSIKNKHNNAEPKQLQLSVSKRKETIIRRIINKIKKYFIL